MPSDMIGWKGGLPVWMKYGAEPDPDQEMTVDDLRRNLQDYYGTAMQQFPVAAADLAAVDGMSDEEVITEARKAGII